MAHQALGVGSVPLPAEATSITPPALPLACLLQRVGEHQRGQREGILLVVPLKCNGATALWWVGGDVMRPAGGGGGGVLVCEQRGCNACMQLWPRPTRSPPHPSPPHLQRALCPCRPPAAPQQPPGRRRTRRRCRVQLERQGGEGGGQALPLVLGMPRGRQGLVGAQLLQQHHHAVPPVALGLGR